MTHAVHPMMPQSNHDELAEQQFVVALKGYLFAELEPPLRTLTLQTAAEVEAGSGETATLQELRPRLARRPLYQNWVSGMRAAQELMWQAAGDCVDRQESELERRAAAAPALGTLRTDPNFVVPRYLAATDTHMMPGSYHVDPTGRDDVRQGALFDKAASLYSLGRQGGQMNDMRGHTVVAHLYERFPELAPKRILEVGCTVGNSLVAVARTFPDAEVHGIDVGASVLRYAHARARHLGVPIHFSQQNAEQTDFPDGSFDVVYSSAVLHETSAKAVRRIFAECLRVLRPGGVMIHLEVPFRAETADAFDWVRADYESRYNNEPFWMGAVTADLADLAGNVGFADAAAGYQDAAYGPVARGTRLPFGGPSKGVYRSWYIVSGRKPTG
jgi:ubiquinone/menaquinone biosynthesis C-methylase UbiE